MKYDNPIIYERIELLVKSHKMCMFDLAKELTISTGNISDWKKGKSVPSTEKLVKIANFFLVPVDYLLGRDSYASNLNADSDCIELTNIYKNLDREGKVSVMSEAYNQRRRITNERERQEAQA